MELMFKMEEENKKDGFSEHVRNELREIRNKQLQEILQAPEKTDWHKEMIDFLNGEMLRLRTDEELLRDNYYKIIDVIDYYLDIKPEYQSIVALWIIGTYMHSEFESFPYLFINAMKGSGKSRLLKLIIKLSKSGQMLNSLTEAVLFRTSGTLAIDEFEGVGSKEKSALRELLNSGYKKGTFVLRMQEKKTMEGKEHVVTKHDVYRPIVMANIAGMDEVLGDRCISIVLEKSNNNSKINLIERFDYDENIKLVLNQFFWCRLCMYDPVKNVYREWNNYIKDTYTTYTTTLPTLPTLPTYTEKTDKIQLDSFFNKIIKNDISGRNLEIFMPLFLIARIIGDDVVNFTLKTAGELVFEKKHEEEIENADIMLIDFVSKFDQSLSYYPITRLTNDFRNFSNCSEEWLKNEWIGRALKRLSLVLDKKRVSNGIEVMLNVAKAKEKIKMFRTEKDETTKV